MRDWELVEVIIVSRSHIPNFLDGARVSPYSLVSDALTNPAASDMIFRSVAGLGQEIKRRY